MKRKMLVAFLCLSLIATGKVCAGGITITGPTVVNSTGTYTYYATPDVAIPSSGYSYSWHIEGGSIVEQNTDPYSGALYCIVSWHPFLGEAGVEIADNHGNSGLLYTIVYGLTGSDGFTSIAAIPATNNADGIQYNSGTENNRVITAGYIYQLKEAFILHRKRLTYLPA